MLSNQGSQATGIEGDQPEEVTHVAGTDEVLAHSLRFASQHLRLTQVVLTDVTDRHNELVHELEWLLHPSERELPLSGNLFVIEDVKGAHGKILVKRAPLPHARPTPTASDLRLIPVKEGGFLIQLLDPVGHKDSWTILDYDSGVLGRTRVLHDWQAGQRPSTPSHRVPRFISNTWGDRSRDSRIQEAFLEAEIDAGHVLGVDVFQIDDGWQKGTTSNSSEAEENGGVWEGFWNADPDFWQPHPERLPNGLSPIVDRAQSKGMNLGLWFAPDSWNDFENWQKDADAIVGFYETYGIEHIKIDGVKAGSELALTNLKRFFQGVLERSQGNVIFDLDVTAEVRPGYFGAIEVGPLFVENRYTDFHNYWPHQTLRNLWSLGKWVDPRRLRMEFLNNSRNTELYENDPLAPAEYDPATLFATVMFGNPLGWFEVSNLPETYATSVPDLVSVWKAHREALFGGTILSVGDAPDGYAYTGFVSVSDTQGYALIFRERNQNADYVIDVPGVDFEGCEWEVLATHGGGEMRSEKDGIGVTIGEELGFVFGRFER